MIDTHRVGLLSKSFFNPFFWLTGQIDLDQVTIDIDQVPHDLDQCK